MISTSLLAAFNAASSLYTGNDIPDEIIKSSSNNTSLIIKLDKHELIPRSITLQALFDLDDGLVNKKALGAYLNHSKGHSIFPTRIMTIDEFIMAYDHNHPYLEAIMYPDGSIQYAIPSHSSCIYRLYAKANNLKTDDLRAIDAHITGKYGMPMIAMDLCSKLDVILLWDSHYHGTLNNRQRKSIKKLKDSKIYWGDI